jgi:hypothetical protein
MRSMRRKRLLVLLSCSLALIFIAGILFVFMGWLAEVPEE